MQRIARHSVETVNEKAIALFAHYDDIIRILLQHLPPSTSDLLARPVLKDNQTVVEWYSQLEGQPQLLDAQAQKSAPATHALIAQRLTDIERLNQRLSQEGKISSTESLLLKQFVEGASHDTRQIYTINQEPVITGWGLGKPPIPPVITAPKTIPWCAWLLPLLLLLGLLGFLWWWFYWRAPVVEGKTPKHPAVPEKIIPTNPPVVETVPLDTIATSAKVATEQCKASTSSGQTPQMVLVFDDSFSMKFSLLESEKGINRFKQRARYGLATHAEFKRVTREPTRLTTAKEASVDIIDKIAKDVDIGLVALKKCPASISYGFYSPDKRGLLKSKIKKMEPYKDNSGTPLYNGLKKAAGIVDGKDRDAFILLLSDGKDNCTEANICSLAKQLAKQKPKLKINVVDIGGAKAANCIADATGGKVFTAKNKKQVAEMINQAVKPMTTEVCQ